VKRLLDTGVSLQNIRAAIDHLRNQGIEDLSSITLMSDGASIYECRSDDEVIDLLRGGQGVFGIALGSIVTEVEATLNELPIAEEPLITSNDELSLRRARKQAM
jgi:DNA-binding transcriptional MerR regulator